ncbi:hypothetical protein BGZ57DRAFT_976585 [Hyaloscypha finlandica]|nr:hypothetical protein BGZ57DRAFT_976585 [Hyaloscypha finlandica]
MAKSIGTLDPFNQFKFVLILDLVGHGCSATFRIVETSLGDVKNESFVEILSAWKSSLPHIIEPLESLITAETVEKSYQPSGNLLCISSAQVGFSAEGQGFLNAVPVSLAQCDGRFLLSAAVDQDAIVANILNMVFESTYYDSHYCGAQGNNSMGPNDIKRIEKVIVLVEEAMGNSLRRANKVPFPFCGPAPRNWGWDLLNV